MIKSKKQMFLVITIFTLVMMLGTISYAFFNYTRTGATNELLVGNIYFNHTQGNSISLINEFPETREEARGRNDNYITLQITGINESNRDIYYKFILSHGEDVENKVRIDDEYLRFDLIEVEANNEEKYILYNEKFDTVNNTIILKDRVDAGTSNSITRNYKLRMWIDENLLISDTNENSDYTASEYANLFATIKVTAKGEMQNVYYYNSFDSAVTAINEETYVSETDRNSAKAGIYIDTDDNTTNLVFYDDNEINQNYTISKPVDINLYGYMLEQTSDSLTTIMANDDLILKNGIVSTEKILEIHFYGDDNKISNIDNSGASRPLSSYFKEGATGEIVNCTFGYAQFIIQNNSQRNSNVKLINIHNNRGEVAILNEKNSVEIIDSYLYNDYNFVIVNYGKLFIDNSTIFSDSEGCYSNNSTGSFYKCPVAITNNNTFIFNSGYVFGLHSAVSTTSGSKTYVYGGTFESTHHGGFYFAHGPSGVAYIENANIRGISYPSSGKLRPNGTAPNSIDVNGTTYTLDESKTAFYIGGGTSQNGEKVYLVNCNISAEANGQVFVMRSSTPEQNLYMSGCTFNNTSSSQYLRVDNLNSMKLYFGYNNFGNIANISNSGNLIPFATAKQNGIIVETNATYKDIVRPE